ncbi:MAG: small subunit ribosomal protein [Thermotogota bacterium]|nr:small subunit ribosomal protein [Thermotogota bacterium]MDK2864553.1 small subunit ribosomal protein [Thermotogota bacterium]HCZ06322.1 30S ribosomal protein S16 [Thermotogota bacterium]
MVRIRLMRLGKRHRPFYRIVVVDSRRKRTGAYIDRIGYYNPLTDPAEVKVDVEKAVDWILKGAQPSETARRLLSKAGVLKRVHEIKYGGSKKSKEETQETTAAVEESSQEAASEE